jgi:uncharacterized damage-inducible protein DinB
MMAIQIFTINMKKTIVLISTILAIISVGFSQDSILIQSHVIKLTNAKAYTLEVAKLMPESSYGFKPVKDEMSFKEQLLHIGKNIYWLSSTYLAETEDPVKKMNLNTESMSKEQVMKFLGEAYDHAIGSFRELDTKTLAKEFSWQRGKMNKIQFMNLVQDHQTHHRGQLMVYLRLNNIQPPRYTGW